MNCDSDPLMLWELVLQDGTNGCHAAFGVKCEDGDQKTVDEESA